MVEPRGLIGVGMPAQLAKRLGVPARTTDSNLVGGAAFSSAAAIGQFQFYVRANTANAAYLYQLPNNAEVGSEFTIFNIGTTGAGVYPPTISGGTGTVNVAAGATATLVAVATGKGITLIAITASTYDAFLTA